MDGYHPVGAGVSLSDVFRGRPKAVVSMVVVEDSALRTVLWLPAGSRFFLPADAAGNLVKDVFDFDHLSELTWEIPGSPGQLAIIPTGAPYGAILRFFGPEWDAPEWYINLQTPLVRTKSGFEATDLILDVTVSRVDGYVRWKDEAEFEASVARGFLSRRDALELRRSAEAAVAAALAGQPPFDAEWVNWRPTSLTANG